MSRPLVDLLAGPVLAAARGLLGQTLHSDIDGEATAVVISEVEAYDGANDPASHAFRGRTRSNESMFGTPGTAYVYRSYGIHWCLNVAVGPEGEGAAVLLRGGRPVTGEAVMVRRRGRSTHLADGPGKLAQAMGVTGDYDGGSLIDGEVRIQPGTGEPYSVVATPRVGISKAVDLPWRFVIVQQVGAVVRGR